MQQFRQDFPIFEHHPDLVYLDSGASTHKPKPVIDAMTHFYSSSYGTVHRGIYELSVSSTNAYNAARERVAEFIGVENSHQVIFTRGTTDAINLAAFGYVAHQISAGDEILITEVEHHANFVPWQQLAERVGARLVFAPIEDDGSLNLERFKACISSKTRCIAMTHISNVLGTIMPIEEIINFAKASNIITLIDGAQAVAHTSLNMQALDPDFYCFSAHKMYGPTGIGVLYASDRVKNNIQPITFGGDMIETVKKEGTTFAALPLRLEAGTPPICEAIGMAAAIDYIECVGMEIIHKHEHKLTRSALEALSNLPFIQVIGNAPNRSGAISFVMDGVHPHDIGTILDHHHVALRVGHHCAQPTMIRFGVPATARISFGVYNTEDDIKQCIQALHEAKEVFG